ncbi:hypothetical protein MGS77_28495, partial [Klebsiella pneumoniae]|nr:hypothetical protein [Klebsiella pneumoniae]MCW6245304.1 hypothetical protein [Klebsiella pneumoniae]MCW6250744.1 hypothetical protein [Klebsiella pneumoniae]
MAFKAEDITINMSAGQRASALNHISVLRTALYGDCEKELNRFIKEGANKQVISSQADSLIKISRIWA